MSAYTIHCTSRYHEGKLWVQSYLVYNSLHELSEKFRVLHIAV